MQPVYMQAITASLRDEDPLPHWDRFRELFARAYIIADLIGRLGVANEARTLGRRVSYAEPLMTGRWDIAINQFMSKVPMAKALVKKMMPIAKQKAFWVTGIESIEALGKIQELIAQRLTGQAPQREFIQQTQEDAAQSLSAARLETVMRTNVMTALNEGAMEEQKSLGKSVSLLRLNEVHDPRTRGAPGTDNPGKHWQMDGFIESPNHPIWLKIRPPNGFNCFLSDARVQGVFIGGSKAIYSGPIVEIKTRNGNRITCTPNHPILTGRGWIAADDVTESDDLFSYGGDGRIVNRLTDSSVSSPSELGRTVPNEDMPATIKDVFDNLLRNGSFSTSTTCSSLDFHGDAKRFNGDIDIVGTYGMLPNDSFDSGVQDSSKLMFVDGPNATELPSHSLSPSALLLKGNKPTCSSSPCGPALPPDGFGVGLHLAPLYKFCCGAASHLNRSVEKPSLDDLWTHSQFLRELLEASSGSIRRDNAIEIRRFNYSGHVYDLQSVSGWMVADNIVTSNCRGNVSVVGWASAERLGFAKGESLLHSAIDAHNSERWKIINAGEYPDPNFK